MRTVLSATGLALAAAVALAGCAGTTVRTSIGAPASSAAPSSTAPPAPATHPAPTAPRTAAPGTRAPTAAPPAPASTAAPAVPAAPATTAAPVAPVAPVAPAQPQFANASAVVEQYYQDITDHDYAAAWALGGANIAGESYGQYVAGFAGTAGISLGTVSDFGSDQVSAVLYATQTDGSVKVFQGTYTVSGGVLVGASITQTS